MALPSTKTPSNFPFKHSGQVDEYGVSVGNYETVQENFDSRGIFNQDQINSVITALENTVSGDSGAKNIGFPAIPMIDNVTNLEDALINTMNLPQISEAVNARTDNEGNIETNLSNRLSKMQYFVNVKSFGAKGDGITDDTTAFIDALTYLNNSGGGTLIIPYVVPSNSQTKYKIITGIDISLTSDIEIICAKGVVIDGTLSTTDKLLYLHGNRDTSSALSADAAQLSINLTTNLALNAGDTILITSSDLWDSARSYYYKGEIAEVEQVNGTTITLKQPLNDSYTASTTTIYKLTMPKISIDNLTILRDGNKHGLYVQYVKDISIRNCNVSGARDSCFAVEYCYGGILENNTATDAYYVGTGTSYGLEIDSSQNITVIGGRYLGGRHGITTGGQEPNRFIQIEDVLIGTYSSGSTGAGLDFHGNAEYVKVRNCTITGVLGIAGNNINTDIIGNRIIATATGSAGISFYLEVGKNGYFNIKDNVIDALGSTSQGIQFRPLSNNLTINDITIENNIINSDYQGILLLPNSSSTGTNFSLKKFSIINNDVKSQNNRAIYIGNSSTNYIHVDKLIIDKGIYYNVSRPASTSYPALGIYADDTTDVYVTNSKFISDLAQSDEHVVEILRCHNCTFKDNHVKGAANPYSAYCELSSGNLLIIEKNTFENYFSSGGLRLDQGNAQAVLTIIKDNTFINCSGNIVYGSGQIVTQINQNGNYTTYGTVAPTTNTWKVGDRCINSNPSVGNPKGWVCTVAGSPGTWVSEGNL